jgi:hypothetical protein
LDQAGSGGTLEVQENAHCTSPETGTTCDNSTGTAYSLTYHNVATGAVMTPVPGTTSGYSPAITSPTGPGFYTDASTIAESLQGVNLTYYGYQVSAAYSGAPATGLVSGLIAAFITQSDAQATVIDFGGPIGSVTLDSILKGGAGGCAGDDRDTYNAQTGWWFYYNFTATQVTYTGS